MLVKLVGDNDRTVVARVPETNLPKVGNRFVVPNTAVYTKCGGESMVGMDLRVERSWLSRYNGCSITAFAVDTDLWNPPVA